MRFTWQKEPLGEIDLQRGMGALKVSEMSRIGKELDTKYRHPALFLSAAMQPFVDSDRPVKDPDTGLQKVDSDGDPVWEQEPNEEWNPDAFRMLVAILKQRATGVHVHYLEIDGEVDELEIEANAAEKEAMKAAAGEGKAGAADAASSPTPPTGVTTSMPGSSPTREASLSTTA